MNIFQIFPIIGFHPSPLELDVDQTDLTALFNVTEIFRALLIAALYRMRINLLMQFHFNFTYFDFRNYF